MHRILHVRTVSEDAVAHYAEDYAEVLQLAKSEPEKSGMDSDVLQYFAIDAWAYDIAVPGTGCPGEIPEATTTASDPAATTSADDVSFQSLYVASLANQRVVSHACRWRGSLRIGQPSHH